MSYTLQDLANAVGADLEGDPTLRINSPAGLEEAGPRDIAFLANPRYAPQMARTRAGAVVVSRRTPPAPPDGPALLRVDNPDAAFAKICEILLPAPHSPPRGIHPTAIVDRDARIGRDVSIGPAVVIETGADIGDRTVLGAGTLVGPAVRIGADARLHAGCILREGVVLGDRVILQPGCVVGSDGFGYVTQGDRHTKIPQRGNVVIEDDVELGACVTVDRARFGSTRIGAGTKVDNLVHIGHNVTLGAGCIVVAQVGLSGSVRVGNGVVLGGQAGAAGHVQIGDGAVVGGRAGVTKDIPPGQIHSGFPARPHKDEKRRMVGTLRIPALEARMRALEEALAALRRDTDTQPREP